jgi:hypothetical protein
LGRFNHIALILGKIFYIHIKVIDIGFISAGTYQKISEQYVYSYIHVALIGDGHFRKKG